MRLLEVLSDVHHSDDVLSRQGFKAQVGKSLVNLAAFGGAVFYVKRENEVLWRQRLYFPQRGQAGNRELFLALSSVPAIVALFLGKGEHAIVTASLMNSLAKHDNKKDKRSLHRLTLGVISRGTGLPLPVWGSLL